MAADTDYLTRKGWTRVELGKHKGVIQVRWEKDRICCTMEHALEIQWGDDQRELVARRTRA